MPFPFVLRNHSIVPLYFVVVSAKVPSAGGMPPGPPARPIPCTRPFASASLRLSSGPVCRCACARVCHAHVPLWPEHTCQERPPGHA